MDRFQFLRPPFGSLLKNFCKVDHTFLSREFDNNILDSVKKKEFYPYENMSDF